MVLKYANLLVSHTMSKTFGLAAFRFGYLILCIHNISEISSIRNSKNITMFTHKENYPDEVHKAMELFTESINTDFTG